VYVCDKVCVCVCVRAHMRVRARVRVCVVPRLCMQVRMNSVFPS